MQRTLLFLMAFLTASSGFSEEKPKAAAPAYEFRAEHDRDGIGKFFMGREIAHVMGHQGADWLERPEREMEEKTSAMIDALDLKPGMSVADIGAGTGYISWRMARKVGSAGKVYGVDVQPEMIELFTKAMKDRGVTNTLAVLGTISDPKLPAASLDLAILVDVYHEFDHPLEMMNGICASLKAGGRVVFIEFRLEDPNVPIKLVHKMTEAQVKKEMSIHPLEFVENKSHLPWQHMLIFRKKESK